MPVRIDSAWAVPPLTTTFTASSTRSSQSGPMHPHGQSTKIARPSPRTRTLSARMSQCVSVSPVPRGPEAAGGRRAQGRQMRRRPGIEVGRRVGGHPVPAREVAGQLLGGSRKAGQRRRCERRGELAEAGHRGVDLRLDPRCTGMDAVDVLEDQDHPVAGVERAQQAGRRSMCGQRGADPHLLTGEPRGLLVDRRGDRLDEGAPAVVGADPVSGAGRESAGLRAGLGDPAPDDPLGAGAYRRGEVGPGDADCGPGAHRGMVAVQP
jgi:hypothetical protein